jgi:hypothetical protein
MHLYNFLAANLEKSAMVHSNCYRTNDLFISHNNNVNYAHDVNLI